MKRQHVAAPEEALGDELAVSGPALNPVHAAANQIFERVHLFDVIGDVHTSRSRGEVDLGHDAGDGLESREGPDIPFDELLVEALGLAEVELLPEIAVAMTLVPAEQDPSDAKKGPFVDPKYQVHRARDGLFFPHNAHTGIATGLVVTFDACRHRIERARVIDAARARKKSVRFLLAQKRAWLDLDGIEAIASAFDDRDPERFIEIDRTHPDIAIAARAIEVCGGF